MKKAIILFIFLAVVIAGLLIFRKNIFPPKVQENYIQINGQKILVEIASTEAQREQGLSGRENLCSVCGMLFLFSQAGNYPFWMKEMKFNLDMLWISGNRVVKIVKNISFEKGKGEVVDPQTSADKVLEINAGQSGKWGIGEGDEQNFDNK